MSDLSWNALVYSTVLRLTENIFIGNKQWCLFNFLIVYCVQINFFNSFATYVSSSDCDRCRSIAILRLFFWFLLDKDEYNWGCVWYCQRQIQYAFVSDKLVCLVCYLAVPLFDAEGVPCFQRVSACIFLLCTAFVYYKQAIFTDIHPALLLGSFLCMVTIKRLFFIFRTDKTILLFIKNKRVRW